MAVLADTTTGQGPAVVCLHGQPGSAGDWAAVAELLRDDFTVVALDRLGYGRTGGQAQGFDANADAVIATLDHLGLDRVVIVGHSWAGGVALILAADHPERVSGLVLVSSIGPDDRPHLTDRLLAMPVIGDAMVAATFAAARALLGSSAVRAGLNRFLPEPGRAALAIVTAGIGARPVSDAGDAAWRSFMIEQRAFIDQLDQLSDRPARVAAACEVVVGTSDHVVAPVVGAHLATAIPGASLRSVVGAGHLLPFDHPSEVAEAVRTVSSRRAPGVGTSCGSGTGAAARTSPPPTRSP